MDVGDDDLFAVFDSDSSKAKQVVIPQEDATEEESVTSNNLVKQICGNQSKRAASEETEESEHKKFKTDAETTLMTGLSDVEVKAKIEDDRKRVEAAGGETETENIEEDEAVVHLVEAAPRYNYKILKGACVYIVVQAKTSIHLLQNQDPHARDPRLLHTRGGCSPEL